MVQVLTLVTHKASHFHEKLFFMENVLCSGFRFWITL